MTALASTDVTVTLSHRNIEDRPGMLRRVYPDLAFGDGALTYPSGGVPLPAKENFGFRKQIVFGSPEQPYANGFVYKYDRTNHKLLIFTMGVKLGSAAYATPLDVGGADHYPIENSAGVEANQLQIVGGTVVDATLDLGPLIELPIAIAPAAVTIRMEFAGE